MDPDIVRNKLESLHRCLSRIADKNPETVRDLEDDIDAQDILVLNLERAVQICVDIGSHVLADTADGGIGSMASVFTSLAKGGIIADPLAKRLAKAVGFRNIAVHEYSELDWAIVHAIAKNGIEDFKEFGRDILKWLK